MNHFFDSISTIIQNDDNWIELVAQHGRYFNSCHLKAPIADDSNCSMSSGVGKRRRHSQGRANAPTNATILLSPLISTAIRQSNLL